jgi:hypothetical protein
VVSGFSQFVEAGQSGVGGAAMALFVGGEDAEGFVVGSERDGERFKIACGDQFGGYGVNEGEQVGLLDGDLVEAPAQIGILLDEVGFFVGGGLELLYIGDGVGFVEALFLRGEDERLAGEAVGSDVDGGLFLSFFRGGWHSCILFRFHDRGLGAGNERGICGNGLEGLPVLRKINLERLSPYASVSEFPRLWLIRWGQGISLDSV